MDPCYRFVNAGVTGLKMAMSKLFIFNENNSGAQESKVISSVPQRAPC